MRRILVRACAIALGSIAMQLPATSVLAQDWARAMFDDVKHDFGAVARSSKTEYEFTFTNRYVEDVQVSSVTASCGCTTPSVKGEKRTLRTHERGAIVAHINSSTFLGNRSATITVTFDKPRYAQVHLQVSADIRDDVVLEPGSVQFGTVSQGAPAVRQVQISTHGNRGLEITGARSPNATLTAQLTGDTRLANRRTLEVRLSESAKPGYVNEHIILTTNDPRLQIPVAVEGMVRAALSVRPEWLIVGVVDPGDTATKSIVVQGDKPFVVTRVIPASGFSCNISSAQEPKLLHVLPVTFVAGQRPGKIAQTLRIETDRPAVNVEFVAEAVVTSGAADLARQPPETR